MDTELGDLYERVGRELKIVEINEALSDEDRQVIADKWPGVYALLEGRGLAQFHDTGPIPARYVLMVEAVLASHCANAFQTTYTPTFDVEREFYRQVRPDYRYDESSYQDF